MTLILESGLLTPQAFHKELTSTTHQLEAQRTAPYTPAVGFRTLVSNTAKVENTF